ncbi:MAG: precorrin-6A reductase [Clostridiales bacterium]|nr:precorrin-6A reductase [Clostridiales bacterium]
MDHIKNSDQRQNSILIFGGTIEGRQVSDYLCERHAAHTVCVATEYGEEVLRPQKQDAARMDGCQMEVHQGRMNLEQICEFLRSASYVLVVDATHPYAVEVSKNIREACQKEQVPYIRYLREDSTCTRSGVVDKANLSEGSFSPVYVGSALEAAQYLETRQGGIFLTTGSKELHVFTETISDITRIFARVLPSAEVVASCHSLGLEGKQICAMQGPFSLEMNMAMLRQTGCAYLVTKETGASGGFPEKMEAARGCQAVPVVIRRPQETGCGWEEVKTRLDAVVKKMLEETSGADAAAPDLAESETMQSVEVSQKDKTAPDREDHVESCGTDAVIDDIPRRISCIGIGMGTPQTLTCEAAWEIQKAQVIFGAERMLDCARSLLKKQAGGSRFPADSGHNLSSQMAEERVTVTGECGEDRGCPVMIPEYNAKKIYDWLSRNPQYRRAAILMSGDVGFYSGAKGIAETFKEEEVHYFCGISSVVYFASRIPTPWQDAKLLSAHGKELPITNYVKKYPKIILLVGGAKGVRELCQDLNSAEIRGIRVTVGSNLSYAQEQIEAGEPGEFLEYQPSADGPCIMMLENPSAGQIITPGIPDDRFVRSEKVPMTKEEIRALSVAKLRLKDDSVVYDVGAGTGSVSVECARLCTKGTVYAIERNQNALEVMRQNCRRFGLSNVTMIHAVAPDGLEDLPAPTHAFIGGSSGNMKTIIETLLEKNPKVRIVINTVTLESIAEAADLIRELQIADADIVQISAAKARPAGRYHLMNALNPVYIISFGGEAEG